MRLLGSRLTHIPVMSLQTGAELARAKRAIIDPYTLKILAYELEGRMLTMNPSLLRLVDVRELSDIGIIVDSEEEFVAPGDIIKLKEIYDLDFNLVGYPVRDENKNKLGKVSDFTIDTTSFAVQQIIVERPLLKSFTDTELLIHRSQIVEINDTAIIVHSKADVPEPRLADIGGSYINPFRKAGRSPEPQG